MTYWRQPLDRDRVKVPHGIVHVIEERCKGCGFCVEFCPLQIIRMAERTNSRGYHPPEITDDSQCVNCGLCALLCPDFAIYVEDGEARSPDQVTLDRIGGMKR